MSNTYTMNYYVEISEITIDKWTKCSNGDLRYTRLDLEIGTDQEDIEAWEKLNNNYVETFGVSAQHARILQLSKRLRLLELEIIISNDKFLLNEINEIRLELEQIFLTNNKSLDFNKVLITLSKYMGFKLKATETTVLEFYTILDNYGKENQ